MVYKNIFILRHGETDFNRRGVVQGSGIDAPLNEKGFKQANAFYQMYKDLPLDKIYTSALQRSIQTINPFVGDGIEVEECEGFNEIHWGKYEGRIIASQDNAYYRDLVRKWGNGETHLRIDGGESPEMVQTRQKKVIDRIIPITHEKNILICMHGRAMRILLATLLGYSLSSMDQFEHQNTSLYQLEYNGSDFSLIKSNDTSHLDLLSIN